MLSHEITAFASVMLTVIASASAAASLAARYGRSPFRWAVVGGFLPIMGVGIIIMLGNLNGRKARVAQHER